MNIQNDENEFYLRLFKIAFTVGGGFALAWTLVRNAGPMFKKAAASFGTQYDTISVEHPEVEVISADDEENN